MASKSIGSLIVKLGFDPKAVDQGLKKFERDLKATGKRMESIGRSMSIGFTAPFLLGLGKAIQAFDEEAQVVRKLQIALGGNTKALTDQAAALQKVTTFSDDQIITQQAYAAALGHSESQIQDMTTAAVGLAAGLGIGLDEAMKNLHKSTTGVAGKVLALIPGIKDLTKEQLQSGEAIKIVNERFKGFAEAAALTGAGPLKVLKNQFGDLMEQMGEAVLPIVIALSEKIKELISWFSNLSPEVKKAIVSWGLLVAAIGPMLIIIPKVIGLLAAMVSPIGITVTALAALALMAVYIVKNWTAFAYSWEVIWWGIKDHVVSNVNDMISSINALIVASNIIAHTNFGLIPSLNRPKAPGETASSARGQSYIAKRQNTLQSPSEFLQSIGNDIYKLFGGNGGEALINNANDLLSGLAGGFNDVGDAAGKASKNFKGFADIQKDFIRVTESGDHVTPFLNTKMNGVSGAKPRYSSQASGIDKIGVPKDVTNSWIDLGNVVSGVMGSMISSLDEGGKSFGQFALEAIKAAAVIIRAKLMEMAVNVIAGSSKAGLPGLIIGIAGATAGIAAVSSLLSNIKTPKLARGGSTYGPTMAMVGDNASGKEMIHPWERNAEFAKSIAGFMGGGRSGIGGDVVFKIRGNDFIGMMKQQNVNAKRIGGQSFSFSGKTGTGGDG